MRSKILIPCLAAVVILACRLPAASFTEQTGQAFPLESVPSATATSLVAVVTAAESLNVRTGPAVSYPPTSYLAAGSAVEIVSECVGGWVRIEYNDMTGWVNADFLNDGSLCQ